MKKYQEGFLYQEPSLEYAVFLFSFVWGTFSHNIWCSLCHGHLFYIMQDFYSEYKLYDYNTIALQRQKYYKVVFKFPESKQSHNTVDINMAVSISLR